MIEITWLRVYLLAGLIGHKLLWEVLKRREAARAHKEPDTRVPGLWLVKTVKAGILLALLAQTLLPEVLPIFNDAPMLRLLGAGLFTLGLAVAITGRLQLGENWADVETPQKQRNQNVVTSGIYRFIRHPIYIGDVALVLGQQLCLNSWLVVLALIGSALLLWQAIGEEKLLLESLPGYDVYCKRTKRFIPFLV